MADTQKSVGSDPRSATCGRTGVLSCVHVLVVNVLSKWGAEDAVVDVEMVNVLALVLYK